MKLLPRDFLDQIASEYDLSPEQREAFVEKFSTDKNEQQIAEDIHITRGAFRTRMSGVYKKFSIGGIVPGKARKLHDLLLREYEKVHPQPTDNSAEIDATIAERVREIRDTRKANIQQECGTMRVLDMTQPIGLGKIYTQVNILEKILGRRRLSVEQFVERCGLAEFDRFGLGEIKEKRVPGLEAVGRYRKLIVLGQPGAGKTTFEAQHGLLVERARGRERLEH